MTSRNLFRTIPTSQNLFECGNIFSTKVTSLSEVDQRLKTLINCNIDFTDWSMSYAMAVNFQEYITIFIISYKEEPYPQYNIRIINERNDDEPCLHLRIFQDENNNIEGFNIIGKLVFVRASGVKCSVPDKNAGTWMVKLSIEFFKQLGIPITILEDDALLECPTSKAKTRFLLLRIFMGKRSWYESFGYKPFLSSKRVQGRYPGYDENKYERDIVYLRNIKLRDIINDFKYQDLTNLEKIRASRAYNIFQEYDLNLTLGQIMSDIWTTDCKKYMVLDKALRSLAFSKLSSFDIWTIVYKRIIFVGIDYILYL